MKRQIVLDTETTGLEPKLGHRIIEIGCVELVNRVRTHRDFHCYLNPGRQVEEGALSVHGLSNEFLQDKPYFYQVVEDFMRYIEGAELIIHNASFDLGFLNYELSLLKALSFEPIDRTFSVIDTLDLARKLHPGQRNSLDALCKRYQVNHAHRNLHGALLDAGILSDVYLAMTGGQIALSLWEDKKVVESSKRSRSDARLSRRRDLNFKVVRASDEEHMAHEHFMTKVLKRS